MGGKSLAKKGKEGKRGREGGPSEALMKEKKEFRLTTFRHGRTMLGVAGGGESSVRKGAPESVNQQSVKLINGLEGGKGELKGSKKETRGRLDWRG